ncbi:MAG: polynucleotide adenylyltransferase PcnB [Gammaproteobacteria bacterium]|nr:polynucleotide adenylyltransferase PcnB [Gammaproteobacteria bacterium]
METEPLAAAKLDAKPLNVSRKQVDANAVDVVAKLKGAGFQAWLVGGCVRDLLLGARPKDFDVATNATPEQVRGLFRRSRLVGRRFKITHVRYGRDVIEVSTFRKAPSGDLRINGNAKANGLILRDNAYGTLREDAFRRDFTVNALYYDPHEEQILDYVGGLDDIKRQRLRFIGDARQRLREDPVRLLRAIRFQAKLGFGLDAAWADSRMAERLREIPAARLFDEFTKMFLSGYAAKAWHLLEGTPIPGVLFPAVPKGNRLVQLAMENTDRRIANGRPVTPGFLLAVLLWEDFRARAQALRSQHGAANGEDAAVLAAQSALADQRRIIAMPRRHSHFIQDVWHLQRHLRSPRPKRVPKLLRETRFRAAYDFLLLCADAGLVEPAIGQWWTDIQTASDEGRDAMINDLNPAARHRGGRGGSRQGGRGKSRQR